MVWVPAGVRGRQRKANIAVVKSRGVFRAVDLRAPYFLCFAYLQSTILSAFQI